MVKITTFFVLTFFIFGLATLSNYGINWDATSHLLRGQAYLHYYLTGSKDYTNLKGWNLSGQYSQKVDTIFFEPDKPKDEVQRISMYQSKSLSEVMAYYDYGHPHISDMLSAFFNFVFFQKLGILNDVDSYRIYGILLASLLVGLVFWWTATSYGKFAGGVAVLSLVLYPLFWSESHFNNEKDIPQAAYFAFMLFSFWRGITISSWKWILTAGVFFGLALGTKLNVLFSIFIILPWLLFFIFVKKEKLKRSVFLSLVAAPFLGLLIIFSTWPYFWLDPIDKIRQVINFYSTIGSGSNIDSRFFGPLGINTYAIQWILFTTPLIILFLAALGLGVILIKKFKDKTSLTLFLLLWLIVPILRVTWPGTNIYGGVRQIMEFIPALAIISGIGGAHLRKWIISKQLPVAFATFLVMIIFIPITIKIIEIHPNENVYFNPLIGGLSGAKERNFPGWGVSFGAPYREAIDWVNKNAENNAKLTTGYEILSNIPGIFIRSDIDYKSNRSGYLREGEYVISLRFQGSEKRSYFDMYLDRMIEPVYQIKVDNVPILKIWKNDDEHLKNEWKKEVILEEVKFTKNNKAILIDLGKEVKLSRLEINYDDRDCPGLAAGHLMVSKNNLDWERVPGVLPEEVRIKTLGIQPGSGKFIEPFAGQEARYINFFISPIDTCVTRIENIKLYHFE